jgi:hypothetical protein
MLEHAAGLLERRDRKWIPFALEGMLSASPEEGCP